MLRTHRASLCLLVLILAVPDLASAIKKARLIGIVVDSDGHPIEGVTATATSEQVPGFHEVRVTDKKGVFKIDFEEVNVVYHYRFEKVGYQTLESEQAWRKDGTARHRFVMYPGESATAEDLPPASKVPAAVEAFNAGASAFQANDYPTAIARFEEAVEHDPVLHQAWAALSAAHLEAGHYEAAAETAEKAIALGATHEHVLRARWEAYRNLGDEAKAAEAQAALERAGALAEEAKRIYNEAVKSTKSDDHETAFRKFKEASELDPNLAPALFGVATAGVQTGRYAEAVAAAEALLAVDPHNEQALRLRFNASLKLDDEDLLVDALIGLAPIEPATASTGLWNLALTAYDANDSARARERFGKLLEIDPSRAHCHYFLGLIHLGEGSNDEARRHFERFLQLVPDDPEAGSVRAFLEHL